MKNKLIWIIFAALTGVLLVFFLISPVTNYGGDIAEYFGITESLIKSSTIALTDVAKGNLEHNLQPAYYNNDPGYYIQGLDGNRYPVHFIFYSVIATLVRLVLKVLQINELQTLRLTNLLVLTITVFYIMRVFVKTNFQRAVFLLICYLSPLAWFLIWPGPDVFFICFLLLAVFFFFHKRYLTATIMCGIASWHSQPLAILTLFFLSYFVYQKIRIQLAQKNLYVAFPLSIIATFLGVLGLLAIPYLYNVIVFGVMTPWTILKDGWTLIYGFGMHNMSLQKLFEQFFDLNIGLFWYAPVLLVTGAVLIFRHLRKNTPLIVISLGFIITAFFYQTNPAWHYGTSGYGPTRHILFFLPLLIYIVTAYTKQTALYFIVIALFVVTQIYILNFMGFVTPPLEKTLYHNPYATFILDHFPGLYNPTPEIFVDRTNHTDFSYPTTAIYQVDGKCKKAHILLTDVDAVTKTCGPLSQQYQGKFDNDLLRKTNYTRKVKTREATLWPDPGSCAPDYLPTPNKPFICLHTQAEVLKYTGIINPERIYNIDKTTGVWKIKQGDPFELTVPPGYIVNHYSFEGVYVTY